MSDRQVRSLIRYSGQATKLLVAGVLLVLSALLFFAGALSLDRVAHSTSFALLLAGALATLVCAVAAVQLVRCPRCRDRWLVTALREEGVNRWLAWLATFDTCPRCGYPHSEEQPPAGEQTAQATPPEGET